MDASASERPGGVFAATSPHPAAFGGDPPLAGRDNGASGKAELQLSNQLYLIASGFTGEPTPPVIGMAGATNKNS